MSSADLNVEQAPFKKIKLESDLIETKSETRTVATMCGAWRPEEVDGGHIFVLKTRDGGMSPDPIKEEDFPENIEDFWEASFININFDQYSAIYPVVIELGLFVGCILVQ